MTPFGDTNEDDYDNVNNVNNVDMLTIVTLRMTMFTIMTLLTMLAMLIFFTMQSMSLAKFQNQFNSGIEEARLSSSKVFLYFFSVLLGIMFFVSDVMFWCHVFVFWYFSPLEILNSGKIKLQLNYDDTEA